MVSFEGFDSSYTSDGPIEYGSFTGGSCVSTLTSFGWGVIGTVGSVIVEISSIIFSTAIFYTGWKDRKKFNYYGLNPSKLTNEQADLPAVVFFHAVMHNQSGAIPIARSLQNRKIKNATFTINVVYDEAHPEKHEQEINRQIQEIAQLYLAKGKTCNIITVGHSLGGIVSIDLLNKGTPRNVKVIASAAIASRLKYVEARWPRACHPDLKPQVDAVNRALRADPNFPLCLIAAERDWKVPSEAVLVREKDSHSVDFCSHVSVPYMPKTHAIVGDFIEAVNALQ